MQGLKKLPKIHSRQSGQGAMFLLLTIAIGYFVRCQLPAQSQGSFNVYRNPILPGPERKQSRVPESESLLTEGPVKYLVCRSNQIAAALATGKANRWMFPGLSMQSFSPSFNTALTIAVQDEGSMIAVGGDNGKIALWPDLDPKASVTTKMPNSFSVTALAFGHKETRNILAVGSKSDLLLFDCTGRDFTQPARGHKINGIILRLDVSPDGERLAVAVVAGTGGAARHYIYLYRIVERNQGSYGLTQEATFEGHKQQIFWLTFSPDGKRLASTDEGGVTLVWDLAGQKEGRAKQPEGRYLRTGKMVSAATSAVFANKSRSLIVGYQDGKIAAFDIGNSEKIIPKSLLAGHTARVSALGILPDEAHGERLVSGSFDRSVRIWALSGLWEAQVANAATGIDLNVTIDGQKITDTTLLKAGDHKLEVKASGSGFPNKVMAATLQIPKAPEGSREPDQTEQVYVDDKLLAPGDALPDSKSSHKVKFVVNGKTVEGVWTPAKPVTSVAPAVSPVPSLVLGMSTKMKEAHRFQR